MTEHLDDNSTVWGPGGAGGRNVAPALFSESAKSEKRKGIGDN